jgi:hypothetical protein
MFTTAELLQMRERAWRESARCWQEYHNTTAPPEIREILRQAAASAEQYWAHICQLIREQEKAA